MRDKITPTRTASGLIELGCKSIENPEYDFTMRQVGHDKFTNEQPGGHKRTNAQAVNAVRPGSQKRRERMQTHVSEDQKADPVSNDSSIKSHLELTNGKVSRGLEMSKQSNAIRLGNYRGLLGVFLFMIDTVVTLDHLMLVIHFLMLFLCKDRESQDLRQLLIIALISLNANGFINIMQDQRHREFEETVNQRIVEKYSNKMKRGYFKSSTFGQINQGDIIKVKHDKDVPCDALILNILQSKVENQTCYELNSLLSEYPVTKKSFQGTATTAVHDTNAISKFIETISGTIKWEYNTSGFVRGSFKQHDNPVAIDITPDNIVHRGSKVTQCQAIICLALNVGHKTMADYKKQEQLHGFFENGARYLVKRQTKQYRKFQSTVQKYLQRLKIASFLATLLPFIAVFAKDYIFKFTKNSFSKAVLMEKASISIQDFSFVASVVSNFMFYCPYLAQICIELVIQSQIAFVMNDINLVPSKIRFRDFHAMKNLGSITSVVFDKESLIDESCSKVAAVKCDGIFIQARSTKYHQDLKRDEFKSKYLESESSCSSDDSDSIQDKNLLNYLPNQNQNSFQIPDMHARINRSKLKTRPAFTQLLTAITILHHGMVNNNKSSKNRSNYTSAYKEDITLLEFAELQGMKFLGRDKQVITVSKDNVKMVFEYIELRRVQVKDDFLNILVTKFDGANRQSRVRIFCLGHLRTVLPIINLQQAMKYEADGKMFQKQGHHPICVAKRELEDEETHDLLKLLGEVHLKQNEQQLNVDNYLLKLCTRMKPIGILGIKHLISERNTLLVDELERNGIRSFMLSQQSQVETLADYNMMKLNKSDRFEPLFVTGDTERQIEASLKSCLKLGTENFTNHQRANTKLDKKSKARQNGGQKLSDNTVTKAEKVRALKSKNFKFSSTMVAGQDDESATDQMIELNKNSVVIQGETLKIILQDESLTKVFLMLCSISSLIVGSRIDATQKRDLMREIRKFAIKGDQGHVMAVVKKNSDRFMHEEADVSVGIIEDDFKEEQDAFLNSDIQMVNLNGLTYLLLKHGYFSHRRQSQVLNEFTYRTMLCFLASFCLFIMNDFSVVSIFQVGFYTVFMTCVSPLLYIIESIFYIEYGQSIFHRVFGQYLNCTTKAYHSRDIFKACFSATFDFMVLAVIVVIQQSFSGSAFSNGKTIGVEILKIKYSLIFLILHMSRCRNTLQEVWVYTIAECIIFILLSQALVLEQFSMKEEYENFFYSLKGSSFLLQVIFVTLCVFLKRYCIVVWNILISSSSSSLQKYRHLEDKLYKEQFEMSAEEIIWDFDNYSGLSKNFHRQSLHCINMNMMKITRSDSMDQTIDLINDVFSKNYSLAAPASNHVINKFNMRLLDGNKEIEYNVYKNQIFDESKNIWLLWVKILINTTMVIFKVWKSFAGYNIDNIKADIDVQGSVKADFESSEIREDSQPPSYDFKSISQASIDLVEIFLFLIMIYIIKRSTMMRKDLIMLGIITTLHISINLNVWIIDPLNPVNDIQYFFVVIFTYFNRTRYYFITMWIKFFSMIFYVNKKFSVLDYEKANSNISISSAWTVFSIAYMSILWIYQSYRDEIDNKLDFVSDFKSGKELQKLKSIINILIPSFVREKIEDGKKNFSDLEQDVTVVFVDIDNSKTIIQQQSAKDFLEFMNVFFDGLDQLCERHGISKIETIGTRFLACGGLKIYKREDSNQRQEKHHSLNVVDFALSAISFAKTIQFRFEHYLEVKIGINSGPVITGVIGDTKPQFSLIGYTVNKAAKLCSACIGNNILVSKESQTKIASISNGFNFKKTQLVLTEFGVETAFSVTKNKILGFRARNISLAEMQSNRSLLLQEREIIETPLNMMKSLESSQMLNNGQKQNKRNSLVQQSISNGLNLPKRKVSTSQSLDESKQNVKSDQNKASYNSNNDVSLYDSEYLDGDKDDNYHNNEGVNMLVHHDLRADTQIINNPGLNEIYHLVERPKFLLLFENKEDETKYGLAKLNKYYGQQVFYQICKNLLDLAIMEALCMVIFATKNSESNDTLQNNIHFGIFICTCVVLFFNIYMNGRLPQTWLSCWQILQCIGFLFSCFLLFMSQHLTLLDKKALIVTLQVYQTIIWTSYVLTFKVFMIMQICLQIIITEQDFFSESSHKDDMRQTLMQLFFNLICTITLIKACHNRDMQERYYYNQRKIIQVEIERSEELIGKLIPSHVMTGIRNDQRFVDKVENATLLHAEIVNFSQLIKDCTPQEVVNLLSQIYSKFDLACEQFGVYKCCQLGDSYKIMSKPDKDRRGSELQREEAYKIIQVGLSMCEIIMEETVNSQNPLMRGFSLRIGIHTGNLIGGIIGSKIVHYEIFGQDIQIANMVQTHGVGGQVCISETTLKLIEQDQNRAECFEIVPHKELQVNQGDLNLQTYIVTQNSMISSNGSQSENLFNSQESSGSYESVSGDQISREEESAIEQSAENDPWKTKNKTPTAKNLLKSEEN